MVVSFDLFWEEIPLNIKRELPLKRRSSQVNHLRVAYHKRFRFSRVFFQEVLGDPDGVF